MELEREHLRYAHSQGHTDVCYSSDGKHILTCGSDGDVRIWSGFDDVEPASECFGETVIAVAFGNDKFYLGTDNNFVQACTFPDAQRDGIISRFTAPVTHITVSKDGSLVAACSCDMEIQVTHTATSQITRLSGHTGPVLGLALDPLNKYVASSSCDGTVKVWQISSASAVKTFHNMVPTSNDFFRATLLCRSAWKPVNGTLFAVPFQKEVAIYERDTWKVKFHLLSPKIEKSLSIVLFSPCGDYLLATSISGEMIIWNINTRSVLSYSEHPKKVCITGIAWHPVLDEIAICDKLGQLGTMKVPVITVLEAVEDKKDTEDLADNASNNIEVPSFSKENDILSNEDSRSAVSLADIKESAKLMSPLKSTTNDDDDDENENRDDDVLSDCQSSLPEGQPSFQPSSTPVHLQHRFMLWNATGIVRCYNTEEERSIDVEFHDTMLHHAIHMNNFEDYSLAALSDKVLALACGSTEENSSKLTCVLLNAWDGSKEWSALMPKGENVAAVAAAGDWVAVATDSYFLRVYSHSGIQRQIISVPGPVVCMSGHGQLLLVVWNNGIGLSGSQNLNFSLYSISPLVIRTVTTQPLALFPKSTLKWAGFTDEGTPCTFDSEDVLRTFSVCSSNWAVLFDARTLNKSDSDHYFVIGVSERLQNLRCVLCKGSYYPMTTPRPTVVEVHLKIPFCEPESEKSMHEDVFWRTMHSLPSLQNLAEKNEEFKNDVDQVQKTLKQAVIKLFASACRSDADMRATDVAGLMSEQPLQMAIKYASKFGKMYLAEKLNNVQAIDWDDFSEYAQPIVEPFKRGTVISNHTLLFNNIPRRETNEHHSKNYSQDMFEESQSGKEENLLLAAEREEESDMSFSSDQPNPFKVQAKKTSEFKGLSFLDNMKANPMKTNKVVSQPPSNKVLKTKVSSKVQAENKQPKKQTFVQWYEMHRHAMQEQFPNLKSFELTKVAMKKFKEETSSKVNDLDSKNLCESDSQEATVSEHKKRKLDKFLCSAAERY